MATSQQFMPSLVVSREERATGVDKMTGLPRPRNDRVTDKISEIFRLIMLAFIAICPPNIEPEDYRVTDRDLITSACRMGLRFRKSNGLMCRVTREQMFDYIRMLKVSVMGHIIRLDIDELGEIGYRLVVVPGGLSFAQATF